MGIKLLTVMTIQYVVCALVFAMQKDWGRMLYFIGAVLITIGVIKMR